MHDLRRAADARWELLGQSQIGLTLDTYSHAVPGLQNEAVPRLGALLSISQ